MTPQYLHSIGPVGSSGATTRRSTRRCACAGAGTWRATRSRTIRSNWYWTCRSRPPHRRGTRRQRRAIRPRLPSVVPRARRRRPREPFPRCCIRSVTEGDAVSDRATIEATAWNALADAELVELAQRGQRGAFRELMQRCNQRLFRVARAVVRDDAEAEDVVQEAYTH